MHILPFDSWQEIDRFFGNKARLRVFIGRVFYWTRTRVYVNDRRLSPSAAWAAYWRAKGMDIGGVPINLQDDSNHDAPQTARMLNDIGRHCRKSHAETDDDLPTPEEIVKFEMTPCPGCGHTLARRCQRCGLPMPDNRRKPRR